MFLCKMIEVLQDVLLVVIEGDQQIQNDVDWICVIGVLVIQVNIGKGCYLDGYMVGYVIEYLVFGIGSVFFIENVGNLVCLVSFDFGEDCKVVIFFVIEGEDKFLKYFDMFMVVWLVILNKVDFVFYCDVDLDFYEVNLWWVNLYIEILRLLVCMGEGMQVWMVWFCDNLVVKVYWGVVE